MRTVSSRTSTADMTGGSKELSNEETGTRPKKYFSRGLTTSSVSLVFEL